MKFQMTRLPTIATSVIAALLAVWFTGFLNQVVPSPAQTWLAMQNSFRGIPERRENSFRIVLCWLQDDSSGRDTENVEDAFASIDGIELVRSATIVDASGAADQWRQSMRRGARAVIARLKADIALVGLVKRPGAVVSLWFVRRLSEGTLDRGDSPYKLEDMTLGPDFHDDLRAQLTAMAWSAVGPFADSDTIRGRMVDKGLTDATERLSTLLDASTIESAQRRAALHFAFGNALSTLGRREGGAARLEQAAGAFRAALSTFTRESTPLRWAAAQDNLAVILSVLGSREHSNERLVQAIHAHRAAFEEFTREHTPRDWAAAQDNLGNTLSRLGERETGTERFEQAIDAYLAALQEHTRERMPLRWAATQNNLGTALTILGQRDGNTDRLEQAVAAFDAALEERPRDRVPLDWASTQNNLGIALAALGELTGDSARLEQALLAHRAALQERTLERVPLAWAISQNNLGKALFALGECTRTPDFFEQAADAYRAALSVLDRAESPHHRDMARNNLDEVLRRLHRS